ncbi:beta-ketoacyl-[acyl-carrier-protein] synthase family protein [Streptomyces sp. NPDC029674]|uniref:beta-ketoacyl-[acyl-carrier-protein] synthase family protein n=1 Tax=Streptomyces sp. NPDC029674 TaxID=3365297 RepID=UPI00384D44B9
MSRTDIAITGIGLVTAAGDGTDPTWQGVLSGASTATRDPRLAGLPVDFSCRVPALGDLRHRMGGRKAWRMGRFVKLAVLAAREAVRDARLDPRTWDGTRVAVVIGCSLGGTWEWEEQHQRLLHQGADRVSPLATVHFLPNIAAGEVSIDLGARGPGLCISTACASGATALVTARDLLAQDACDIAVAGGTEASTSPLTTTSFHRTGALSSRREDVGAASRPFAADRDGFVMAEGAGVLVLERAPDAHARGHRPRALLAGCATTSDAHHPTAQPEGAPGAERALRAALADACLTPRDVDHVNAHGTSTLANDMTEAALITRVLPHHPTVTAAKGVLGHSLGAAGAIEAALTALTIQHGQVPPIANLRTVAPGLGIDCVTARARPQRIRAAVSHSFGFGGHNAVLVLAPA